MMSTSLPLVTVAVPSHNHAKYIEACIKSVIGQTYPRIELIIIDDGSSDDSIAVIDRLGADCRARFERFEFRTRGNKGLCNTLNEALAWAQGTYFAITDSDDILLPDQMWTLVREIHGEVGTNGVFGGAFVIDEEGRRVGAIRPNRRYYSFSDILARDKNMISSSGLLCTEAMRRAGGYLSNLYIEDWYMMLKLSEDGSKLKTFPTPLVLYRLHSTNISKSVQKMLDARMQILDLFSGHPRHAARKALVHVEAALDFWRISKASSVRHLKSAVKLQARIVTHPLFWAAVARIMTPTAIMDHMKSKKDRKQQLLSLGSAD